MLIATMVLTRPSNTLLLKNSNQMGQFRCYRVFFQYEGINTPDEPEKFEGKDS